MKRTLAIFALGATILAFGCVKLKNLTTINVDIPYTQEIDLPNVDTTLPFPAGGISLPLPSMAVATNSAQYISGNNTTADKVTSVTVTKVNMVMTSPPNKNFNFLDSMSVYLSAKNLPEILLANKLAIPKGVTTLNLDLKSDSSLKNYFLKDTMFVRFSAHFNAWPPYGGIVNSNVTFHMVANPLN